MKSLLLAAICCVLCSTVVSAQTYLPPYGVTNPTYVATITTGSHVIATQAAKETKAGWAITVLRSQSGTIEYTIDANTVDFSGDLEPIEAMTASEIFDVISALTIDIGVDSAYAECSASMSNPAGVTTHSCVTRDAYGFSSSGSNTNRRAYTYICPSAGTVATLGSVAGTFGCGGGSEETWEEGGSIE